MTQLELVRGDIDTILDITNEFATDVTYFENTLTFDDDGSINDSTQIQKTITILFQPENTATLKLDNTGQLQVGTAKVFFKFQYVFTDITIIPKNDNNISVDGVIYRITQLKPWTVNTGVAYYEATVTRVDLN